MVEAIVAIGVCLIVASLVVPLIARSLEQARSTADLATLRSNGAIVFQYASESSDAFPSAGPTRCTVAAQWHQPVIQAGLLRSERETDPRTFDAFGRVSFYLSECLAADPIEFTPGWTRPCAESPASIVTQGAVAFPSNKGMMFKAFELAGDLHRNGRGDRYFCCGENWKAPVVFCDGSGQVGAWRDYVQRDMPAPIDGVGRPIVSSWGGFRARDR